MQNVILMSSLILGVIAYGLIAKWYLIPVLERHSQSAALQPLILLHCFRYLGLAFLLPGVIAAHISPTFAVPAAYGDLAAALLAFVAVLALRYRWSFAMQSVWVFNVVGTLDLLNALMQGVFHIHAGQLGGAYIIPSLIVPALLVSHYLVFRLLVRPAVA